MNVFVPPDLADQIEKLQRWLRDCPNNVWRVREIETPLGSALVIDTDGRGYGRYQQLPADTVFVLL